MANFVLIGLRICAKHDSTNVTQMFGTYVRMGVGWAIEIKHLSKFRVFYGASTRVHGSACLSLLFTTAVGSLLLVAGFPRGKMAAQISSVHLDMVGVSQTATSFHLLVAGCTAAIVSRIQLLRCTRSSTVRWSES